MPECSLVESSIISGILNLTSTLLVGLNAVGQANLPHRVRAVYICTKSPARILTYLVTSHERSLRVARPDPNSSALIRSSEIDG